MMAIRRDSRPAWRGERLTSRELPLAASAVRAHDRQLYWQIGPERANRRSA
jgi:hypothetical protein